MRYLKLFNESKEQINYKNILEICKECLVEHLDNGFQLEIEGSQREPFICFDKILSDHDDVVERYMWFKWDDVKDDFVKLINIISDTCTIHKIVIGHWHPKDILQADDYLTTLITTSQEILDDIKVPNNAYFVNIFFK